MSKIFEYEKMVVLMQLASRLALIAKRMAQASVVKIDVSTGSL